MVIVAKSWKELLKMLLTVSKLIENFNLTLNIKKFKFGQEIIDYLEYKISKDGIKPGDEKLGALVEFPRPRNVHDTLRLYGLAGFFRRNIPHFAEKRPEFLLRRKTR